MSALDYAVVHMSMNVAKVIIEHGVDVNAAGADGTALHHAAASEADTKMSLPLLANGAAVDALDGTGGA